MAQERRKIKRFEVEKLREMVNKRLADPNTHREARLELGALLTTILHQTGNYKGFNYVDWLNGGSRKWEQDGRPEDNTPYLGDRTKVFFF